MFQKTREQTGVPFDLRGVVSLAEVKGHSNLFHSAFASGNETERHMGPERTFSMQQRVLIKRHTASSPDSESL